MRNSLDSPQVEAISRYLPERLQRIGMVKTKREYLQVPRGLISDRSMSSSGVRVLTVLIDLCSATGETNHGLDSIAKLSGLGKRTVCDAVVRLEKRGFINRDSRRGPYTGIIRLNSLVDKFSA